MEQQLDAVIGLRRAQLDDVPWAVARVDRTGVFTYGNRAMCEILGVDGIEGRNITDVFRGDDLDTVRAHLDSRFSSGASDEYDVNLVRPVDGASVPIRCSAMPEVDASGRVTGVFAIVRDLLAEDVRARIYEAMQDLREGPAILAAVARQCQRLVPFDLFDVTLYSESGEHARQLFMQPAPPVRASVRWYEMSGHAKALIAERRVINVPDIEQWLEQPQWRQYRAEPDMQMALSVGFRARLSFPVIVGSRVLATVSFSRLQGKGPFRPREEELLAKQPLRAAVRAALHYQKTGELAFALGLMRRMAAGPLTTQFIADTLIEEMASHYQWENVSIFRPDQASGQMCLVGQKAQNAAFLLPEGWRHPIDKGITGLVFRTGTAVNVPDVHAPDVTNVYLAGFAESSSELCLPINVNGRVFWLLNVEDSRRNAFAPEEQEALEGMLREIAVMLEVVSQTQMFGELLRLTQDAVIQTDYRGAIVELNPAAARLLGQNTEALVGTRLADHFKDADQARRIEEAKSVPNEEVVLRREGGGELHLLLSGTSLPPEIGRKVYIGNDLSTRKPLETIEILREMYNEIAGQIKTPLSLAFTWLDRLGGQNLTPRAADLLDKSIKQLHKVDLSFERMLFYERHGSFAPVEHVVFELPVLMDKVCQELPDAEAAQVELKVEPGVAPVRGDLSQIWFCLESLLAYLLRFAPEGGKVQVCIAPRQGQAEVSLRGRAPRITGGRVTHYAARRWAIRSITEVAVGERMIRGFIVEHHGGEFHRRRIGDEQVEYSIVLPSALGEDGP